MIHILEQKNNWSSNCYAILVNKYTFYLTRHNLIYLKIHDFKSRVPVADAKMKKKDSFLLFFFSQRKNKSEIFKVSTNNPL